MHRLVGCIHSLLSDPLLALSQNETNQLHHEAHQIETCRPGVCECFYELLLSNNCGGIYCVGFAN